MFGVFTVNEFQDESNESLEPQDNSTPASNDNISQDSAPEEVGNEVQQDAPVETTESVETPAEPVAEEERRRDPCTAWGMPERAVRWHTIQCTLRTVSCVLT